jgi:ankyrin repeat protein
MLTGHEGNLIVLGLTGAPLPRWAIHCVARQGRVGCCEILIALGSDLSGHPVEIAAAGHHWDVVKLLIQADSNPNGCSPDRPQMSALHWAAGAGKLDVVETLVAAGGDVRALNTFLMTPMMYAISANRSVSGLLTDYDMSHQNKNGSTTLSLASSHGMLELVADLATEETVNITDRFGQTPLSLACSASKVGVVKILLCASADPNLGGAVANTVRNRDWPVLRLLRNAGADIGMPNCE